MSKNISQQEIDGLNDVYNSLNGPSWIIKWNITQITNNTNICNQWGITCSDTSQIIGMDFEPNNLTGTIPKTIGNFLNLSQLIFHHNFYIYGSIPDTIGNLINLNLLEFIRLDSFTSTIPNAICNLINMNTLLIAYNYKLKGTIPNCIGSFKKLTDLEYSSNLNINGSIPNSICNLTKLKYLFMYNNPNLASTIPDCIGGLNQLQIIDMHHSGLYGSIPSSIGNFTNLSYIDLDNNCLNGTIPTTIGNLIKLQYIDLRYNNLTGTIPPSIGNLTNLQWLDVMNNSLTGIIPLTIGNLLNLISIRLMYNKLSDTIPSCISNMKKLDALLLGYNNLYGTIPSWIGSNLENLSALNLENNTFSGSIPTSIGNLTKLRELYLSNNLLSGPIPESIGKLQHLTYVWLSNNSLSGTIPVTMFNISTLKVLFLSNNSLSGSIPSSIVNLTNLQALGLADNNFYSEDILDILSNTEHLQMFSISNNVNINGDISKLGYVLNQTSLNYFIAHSCGLYGTLPKNISFTNLQYFTIQNNRLSCKVPSNLIENNHTYSILLASNLFTIENDVIPNWMNSSFTTARSLYLTNVDYTKSFIFVIFSGLSIIIILATKTIKLYRKKNDSNLKNDHDESLLPQRKYALSDKYSNNSMNIFFKNIEIVKNNLSSFKLMIMAMILILFYFYNSYYFKCSLLSNQLSLSYYHSKYVYNDWILIALLILIYIIILDFLVKCMQDQQRNEYFMKGVDGDEDEDDDDHDLHEDNTNNVMNISRKKKTIEILLFIFYLFLFLLFTSFVVMSAIFESLPDRNVFKLNSWKIQLIQKSLGIILAINTSLIIPGFVSSLYKIISSTNSNMNRYQNAFICKYRPFIILFLRTLSTLIIPLLSSIFLLQNCGNNWTYFWKECNDENKSQFDIHYVNPANPMTQQLLDSSEICSSTAIHNIAWGKCLRTFCANWSSIITQKLCIMIIMPFIMIYVKKIKNKMMSKVLKKNYSSNNVKIDMEYSMILTKCESMIIWGVISPLIFPLTFISIYSNYYFYNKMINKYYWKLYPFDIHIIFPIYCLWIGLIFSQCFISIFIFICIDNKICGYVLISILIVINIIYLIKYFKSCKK